MKSILKFIFLVFLPDKLKTNLIYRLMQAIMLTIALGGCKKDDGGTGFPVNETFATELIGRGIPADIARFFAAAKMETNNPNDTTCIYLQTFPNGASWEIILQVSPNRHYTPTAGEIANNTGRAPVYAFKYASIAQANGNPRTEISYYVAKAGLPQGGEKHMETFVYATDQTQSNGLLKIASGTSDSDGAWIYFTETAKSGADVTIGSLIDFAKDKGIETGPLGSIYALASALSAVTGALDLSKQNSEWLAKLDALEKCAANPTNQVSRSDPTYSAAAVARVQAARSELKQVNAVRFLNNMTETGAGINPVTAILAVGLKPAFLWCEQTLGDYSESTIMREAQLTVVPCDDSGNLDGNIDVLWDCTDDMPGYQVDHEVWHIVTKVMWVYDPALRGYVSQGTFTFEYTLTSTTYEGKTCTDKKTAAGSIGATGRLVIVNTQTGQDLCSCGYFAEGDIDQCSSELHL